VNSTQHGTKHPLQHYTDKHPKELERHFELSYKQPGIGALFKPSYSAELSPKEQMAIAVCLGKHSLPFSFFDDPTMQWGFGFRLCGNTVKNAVVDLHSRLQRDVGKSLTGKKGTIALDGWTNPVTKEKHICVVAQPITADRKIFFTCSTVMQGSLDTEALHHFLVNIITDLQVIGFTTVGIVGDNARAQQAAMGRLAAEYPSICQIRCGSHTMNLVMKYIIKEVCGSAVAIVDRCVKMGVVKRYVETRWNFIL
jgi:hypothetical protein